MKVRLLIAACMAISTWADASASTLYACGDVTGTWNSDTVLVTCEVRVPPGQTLIIEPGVRVLFWAYCKLIVEDGAVLHAVGTANDSIVFDEYVPSPILHENRWNGIRFLSASSSSRLEYCHLKHGLAVGTGEDEKGGGIYCSNSNPQIRHSLVDSCEATYGGGIYCVGANPFIDSCALIGNAGFYFGGAISCFGQSHPSISGCNITGNSVSQYGGGIACSDSSSPIISACIIDTNWAGSAGGGIHCEQGSAPLISGNLISANWCYGWYGGGISCVSASPTILENTIRDNSAEQGGGIGCGWQARVSIVANTITGNRGRYFGGSGIYSSGASTVISNNLISGNTVEYDWSSYGGGILIESASDTILANNSIVGNTIIGNSASRGGGIACRWSSVVVARNLIRGNTATQGGGGIYYSDSTGVIEFNEISGNLADGDGGGIHLDRADVEMNKNTIVHNTAASGGGLYCYYSQPAIRNSIFWGNMPYQQIRQVYASNAVVSYSDLLSFWPGTGNIFDDPLFVDSANGDYHLHTGSPCIDSGDPDPADNDSSGSRADMGCYPLDSTLLSAPEVVIWTEGIAVRLAWTTVASATAYDIYRADSAETLDWSLLTSITDTTLSDPISPQGTRFYQVRAVR